MESSVVSSLSGSIIAIVKANLFRTFLFEFSMTSMTNEEAFAELYYAKKAIYDVLGITVQCWRVRKKRLFEDFSERYKFLLASSSLS